MERLDIKRHEAVRETERPSPAAALSELAPYKPVSSLDRIWANPAAEHFKLDWNESSVPPSPKVYESIVAFLSNSNHLNWYPELGSRTLADNLVDYTGVSSENILVTNGSDDALELTSKAYLESGDKVLVPKPTYTHFLVYCQARDAVVEDFFSDDLFDADVDGLEQRVRQGDLKLVYLVSPNNPTGVVYTRDDMERLLEAAPNTLFIVDEAYHEFHGESVAKMVEEYNNLVVTRTFSKCFGIAGLRMGYLMACEEVMTELKKIFNPKSVNRLGQIAAQACLSDLPHYRRYVQNIDQAKDLLVAAFEGMGLTAHSTPANYMLVQVPEPVTFCERLAERGVHVRDRSTQPRLEGYIRITVPTTDQAPEVLKVFAEVLATF